jgi:4-hydroxy-3-methylbut-2-enyl diphosphate reductase
VTTISPTCWSEVDQKAVREQLVRILYSGPFRQSGRRQRFLEYLVNETLAGRGERLKGYNIALGVFDRPETEVVCEYIRRGGDREEFLRRFGKAASPGFDPDVDLQRIGLANQTTMLMTESLEIGEMIRPAMRERYDDVALAEHYQAFDTICSATQDRQDAVVALLRDQPVDLMIVIGGYNSSNTANLARLCHASRPTFHIAEPECLVSAEEIRHRPVGAKAEVIATGLRL